MKSAARSTKSDLKSELRSSTHGQVTVSAPQPLTGAKQVEEIFELQPYEKIYRPIRTALHQAILDGRIGQCKILLRGMSNVNTADLHGRTPLMMACLVPNDSTALSMVNMFLKHDARINKQDIDGRNAISYACVKGREEIVKRLLKVPTLNINQCDVDGNSPLTFAAYAKNPEVLRSLVEKSSLLCIKLDTRNSRGMTPLMVACQRGNFVNALLLLNAGSNPLLKDSEAKRTAKQWILFHTANIKAKMGRKPLPASVFLPKMALSSKVKRQPSGVIHRDTEYVSSRDEIICKHTPCQQSLFSLDKNSPDILPPLLPEHKQMALANEVARESLLLRLQDSNESLADINNKGTPAPAFPRDVSSAKLKEVSPKYVNNMTAFHILQMVH